MGVITFLIVSLLGATFLIGLVYAQLVKDLPPVGNIEILFSNTKDGFLEPVQVLDRYEKKLFDLFHPQADDRRWLRVGGEGLDVFPTNLQDAIVITHDKSFWTNQGYDLGFVLEAVVQGIRRDTETRPNKSITQRLVEMTILPAEDFLRSDLWRYLREALLAERLTERYSKDQILEWYINSVHFRNLAYGADAASLVYFGKHATELTLAESAMLAAVSMTPTINPFDMTENLKEEQALVLQSMLKMRLITESQYQRALSERIMPSNQKISRGTDLQNYSWTQINRLLGTSVADRSGLHVLTTIDDDLQLQVQCAAEIHLSRLRGQESSSEEVMTNGRECSASQLLPPLRPGDEGLGYGINDVASVILDPRNGEILSFYGPVDKTMPSTSMLYPLIYLAAFSKGGSPGTMVLDIPFDGMASYWFDSVTNHGPISMRTALVGGFPMAAQRTIQSIGVETVLQVVDQMGVSKIQITTDKSIEVDFPERYEISLIDTAYGYGVLANSGMMTGVTSQQVESQGWRSLDPIIISAVYDQTGTTLYEATLEARSILSQELAFLVTDILKDNTARWPLFGQSNVFELDRPSAVMSGINGEGNLSWTIGYTPSRVVGIWLGDPSGDAGGGMKELVGAPTLWHALMGHSTQLLPPEGWEQPPGILRIEVCEPSGLLPTDHCPSMVKELFLDGTEPIHYDALYRPFDVNKETGKLATLYTPLDLIEERIFFVPPPEAMEWARAAGYLQPPNEYDSLEITSAESEVKIDVPQNFAYIKAKKWIYGRTKVDGFSTFRLQYGEGLNPTHWFQIGENHNRSVVEGTLGIWDTSDLDGLYTLQLVVVDQDDIAYLDTVFVTVDNQRPEIDLLCPDDGGFTYIERDRSISCDVRVSDNIEVSKVEFYLDDVRINTDLTPPFRVQLTGDSLVEGILFARAYDLVGNSSESKGVILSVVE